jgi:glycosyltransferase involved in cell wall biosynthesis|tara:strand:+ start:75 stop:1337 length:1263 start_codon:yes stop_codon:yes gene_type:complete
MGEKMKPISFINPSRNNRKYLVWSYASIRKNLGYRHEICVLSDFSNDGTVEWCEEIAKKDKNFKYIVNDGTWFGENTGEPSRMGHTLGYDKLINEVATNDICMIWHADMHACPGMDEAVLKHLEPGKVVSATRIEPPLHPDGPEKILKDFGIEPEEFDEQGLLDFVDEYTKRGYHHSTTGIFAPWAMYKEDFQRIGGHDPLYAPQSKEDSDIFNRFVLAGYELIQTWQGFVYHMTSRGSRFKDGAVRNPDGQVFMKNRETDEWLKQNQRSTRNFIRKWGHMVMHDAMMKPIIPPKYDVGFVVKDCTYNLLRELEPWCSNIYIEYTGVIDSYIKEEQPDTMYDLKDRVCYKYDYARGAGVKNDVVVEFSAKELNADNFQNLVHLSSILEDSGEVGNMELDIFKIRINELTNYSDKLVVCDK